MAAVLTAASSVSCDDGPGGAVTLTAAAQSFFKVSGNAVLAGTLAGATIGTGCANVTSSTSGCASVSTQTAGPSSVLKINGTPALLATAKGATAGTPPSTWSAKSAGQTILTAA